MVPPSNMVKEDVSAPRLTPLLEHVHGLRVEDLRGALGYNAHGSIVHAAGALASSTRRRSTRRPTSATRAT